MINTAVILAAGLGTRLNDITRAVPKELLTVGGSPIIEHCIQAIKKSGIDRVIVVVGYHKKSIIDYLGSGERYGLSISYVFQEEQKGTGNALLYAEKFIFSDFSLVFGDDYIEPSDYLRNICKMHIKSKPDASIGISEVEDISSTSLILTEGVKVIDIIEKPKIGKYKSNFGSNGSFVLSRNIFNYIRQTKPSINGEVFLSDSLNLMLNDDKEIIAVENSDYFMDIGIPERYKEVNRRLFNKS